MERAELRPRYSLYGFTLFGCVLVSFATLMFGVGIGLNWGYEASPAKPAPEVHTRVIAAPQPSRAALPANCVNLATELENVYREAGIVISASTVQLDIMSDAQVAMLERDWKKLVKLGMIQRDNNTKTDSAAVNLAEARARYQTALAACKREVSGG